jgi:hypothetical protein
MIKTPWFRDGLVALVGRIEPPLNDKGGLFFTVLRKATLVGAGKLRRAID